MKKIVIVMMSVLMIASAGYGQSKKELRAREKQAKKEARAREEAMNKELTKKMIESRKFVLEADFVSGKQGQRISVTRTFNFIVVNGDKVAFQFADGSHVGYNGVGGSFEEGNLREYKFKTNKKGMYFVDFRIVSSGGTLFVHLSAIGATLRVDATIKGTSSAQLNYSGYLVPLDKSRVYKGVSF